MQADAPRLALLTPYGVDVANAGVISEALDTVCAGMDVAAIILRMRATDDRALVNLVKQIAPSAQRHGAAVVVCCPDHVGDLASVAVRAGADGVHADGGDEARLRNLRAQLRDGRILGCGGLLESKHDAMTAGEAQVDYVMFGGLYPDGAAPPAERVRERAAWWAEIFETPCIAVAARIDEVTDLIASGAEFIGLEAPIWLDDPTAPAAIAASIRAAEHAP